MESQHTHNHDNHSNHNNHNYKPIRSHFFFVMLAIVITSYNVYNINVNVLQHNRFFTRALHYHILQHQIQDVYWFGQEGINYPRHQYFQLSELLSFLQRLWNKMGSLEQLSLTIVDQNALNSTQQSIYVLGKKSEDAKRYVWTIQQGPTQPFNFQKVEELKNTLISSEWVRISFATIALGQYMWDISITLQPFSDTSVFAYFNMHQHLSLVQEHIVPCFIGLLLGIYLIRQYFRGRIDHSQNILYYFLSFFLVITSMLAFADTFDFQWLFILDGITCFSAWICAIKFYTKHQDYKLSFLLTKSYLLILQLFASFLPLLIAFSLFAYSIFSRYSGQFSSFQRTFTSLFYICYYNMTYQSAIVTSRSNPISLIFFIVFVLVFTICIYSGMLVSVFCSYVWRKRQLQIKQHIVNHLKIHCSSCDHRYKYSDRAKDKKKRSFNLSQFLAINWEIPQEREKYKRVLVARIQRLRQKADSILQQNLQEYKRVRFSVSFAHNLRQDLWQKKRFIQNLVGDDNQNIDYNSRFDSDNDTL